MAVTNNFLFLLIFLKVSFPFGCGKGDFSISLASFIDESEQSRNMNTCASTSKSVNMIVYVSMCKNMSKKMNMNESGRGV